MGFGGSFAGSVFGNEFGGEFSISGGISVGAEGFNLGLIWVTGAPSEDFPIQLIVGGDIAGGLVNGSLQEIEGPGSAINLVVPTPIPSPYGATVSGLNDARGRDYGIQVGVGAGVPVGWSVTDTTTTTLTTRGAAEVIVDWICSWKGC